MSFETPAPPSAGLDYTALKGSLLMVRVLGLEDHVATVHTKPGEKSPAARADVVVLDGPSAGEEYADSLVFPKVLRGQLSRSVGKTLLGRLGQMPAQPGKNPAWVLEAASAADVATATAYQNQKAASSLTSAEPPF